MPNIEKEIRNWLHQQQDWLQEAVEKLLASGSLADSDIQAIAERLKTTAGQRVTTHHTFEGIGATTPSSTEVHLLEIGDISGIENLCPRSPLTFGTGNLAVIYGPNGSGKIRLHPHSQASVWQTQRAGDQVKRIRRSAYEAGMPDTVHLGRRRPISYLAADRRSIGGPQSCRHF